MEKVIEFDKGTIRYNVLKEDFELPVKWGLALSKIEETLGISNLMGHLKMNDYCLMIHHSVIPKELSSEFTIAKNDYRTAKKKSELHSKWVKLCKEEGLKRESIMLSEDLDMRGIFSNKQYYFFDERAFMRGDVLSSDKLEAVDGSKILEMSEFYIIYEAFLNSSKTA